MTHQSAVLGSLRFFTSVRVHDLLAKIRATLAITSVRNVRDRASAVEVRQKSETA